MASKAERMDIDPRVDDLSPEARRCRTRGRHAYPDLEETLREALRHNKSLVNLSEVTVELACACGVTSKETLNVWTGGTIGRSNGYGDAKDYLMPLGTGRLSRDDVRAAVIRDVFGGVRRRR